MQEWKYVTKDKFPAYISWETFELIQGMLKDNYAEYDRNQTRGTPKPGKALLHGIVYCGVCGHKMVVQYKGGTLYLCNALRQQYRTPVCQYIPADIVDEHVVQLFFQALSPAEIDAYEKIAQEQWHQVSAIDQMKRQEIDRLSYQVKLAERQFNQVDPDNRLVAAELERRWEAALKELKAAEEQYHRQSETHRHYLCELPHELKEAFIHLGQGLPKVWDSLSQAHKKAFLRCMIDKIAVHRKAPYALEVRIVWQGGDTTTKEVLIPIKKFKDLPFAKEFEGRVLELAQGGKKDQEIADQLTQEGYRSPTCSHVLPSTVQIIRLRRGYMLKKSQSHPRRVPGFLTVSQLAKQIGVPDHWIYDRIHKGVIQPLKGPKGIYVFPDTTETLTKFLDLKKLEFLEHS